MVVEEDFMERIIDVTAARRQLGTLLDEVFYKKESVTIQRKGKSLARIIPVESDGNNDQDETITPKQKSLLEELEGLPVISIKNSPVDILRSVREEKSIKAKNSYEK